MNNIHSIDGYGGPNAIGPGPPGGSEGPERKPPAGKKNDEVEISQVARYLSRIAVMPEIRADKVEQIRQALAQGNYDIDAKLSVALDRLLDEYVQE